LEGQIALMTLFRRFSTLRLAQRADTLRWRKSLIVRDLEEVPVRVGPPLARDLARSRWRLFG